MYVKYILIVGLNNLIIIIFNLKCRDFSIKSGIYFIENWSDEDIRVIKYEVWLC